MMLRPSIDDLLDRVHSKYSLVILSSKRAHELAKEADDELLVTYHSVKNVGRALEEIESGELVISPHPEEKREQLSLDEELRSTMPSAKNQFDFLKQDKKE